MNPYAAGIKRPLRRDYAVTSAKMNVVLVLAVPPCEFLITTGTDPFGSQNEPMIAQTAGMATIFLPRYCIATNLIPAMTFRPLGRETNRRARRLL
jgi:hypothetical protein